MKRLFLLFPFLLISNLSAAPFSASPEQLCHWMKTEKFGGSSDYRVQKNDLFRCSSSRKPISQGEPVLSDVRYIAEGSERAITEVRLEMQMRSFRQPQGTLRKFGQYAQSLTQNTLAVDLPEETLNALLAGITGEWTVAGKQVSLEKVQNYGTSYDYLFRIF